MNSDCIFAAKSKSRGAECFLVNLFSLSHEYKPNSLLHTLS